MPKYLVTSWTFGKHAKPMGLQVLAKISYLSHFAAFGEAFNVALNYKFKFYSPRQSLDHNDTCGILRDFFHMYHNRPYMVTGIV